VNWHVFHHILDQNIKFPINFLLVCREGLLAVQPQRFTQQFLWADVHGPAADVVLPTLCDEVIVYKFLRVCQVVLTLDHPVFVLTFQLERHGYVWLRTLKKFEQRNLCRRKQLYLNSLWHWKTTAEIPF
jgi:hypothetical protein